MNVIVAEKDFVDNFEGTFDSDLHITHTQTNTH